MSIVVILSDSHYTDQMLNENLKKVALLVPFHTLTGSLWRYKKSRALLPQQLKDFFRTSVLFALAKLSGSVEAKPCIEVGERVQALQ